MSPFTLESPPQSLTRRRLLRLAAGGAAALAFPALIPGRAAALPAPTAPFTLPWGGGDRRFVLQGQNQGSHLGFYSKYAWDFALAPFDSTPFTAVAARDGVVAKVEQGFDDSPDCDASYNARTNYVLLDHGDGYGSVYLHLTKNSVLVAKGQRVDRGQPIAKTGHTGFLCGTIHLHFTIVDAATWESLDVPFADADTARDGGRPKTNEWYWAGTAPPQTPTPAPTATPSPRLLDYRRRFPLVSRSASLAARDAGGQRPP